MEYDIPMNSACVQNDGARHQTISFFHGVLEKIPVAPISSAVWWRICIATNLGRLHLLQSFSVTVSEVRDITEKLKIPDMKTTIQSEVATIYTKNITKVLNNFSICLHKVVIVEDITWQWRICYMQGRHKKWTRLICKRWFLRARRHKNFCFKILSALIRHPSGLPGSSTRDWMMELKQFSPSGTDLRKSLQKSQRGNGRSPPTNAKYGFSETFTQNNDVQSVRWQRFQRNLRFPRDDNSAVVEKRKHICQI